MLVFLPCCGWFITNQPRGTTQELPQAPPFPGGFFHPASTPGFLGGLNWVSKTLKVPSCCEWLIFKVCGKKTGSQIPLWLLTQNHSLMTAEDKDHHPGWTKALENLHVLFSSSLFSLLQHKKNQSSDEKWLQPSVVFPAVQNKFKAALKPPPPAHFISSLDTPRCAVSLASPAQLCSNCWNWAPASQFNAMERSSTTAFGGDCGWNPHGS